MEISLSKIIAAPTQRVWGVITDIKNADKNISGIKSVEILHQPSEGVIGLKWKETRIMFGKEATETMWITAAENGKWYQTRAESHGAVYISRLTVEASGEGSLLTFSFTSQPLTMGAKLMSLMSFMFMGSIKKMLQQDLDDIALASTK